MTHNIEKAINTIMIHYRELGMQYMKKDIFLSFVQNILDDESALYIKNEFEPTLNKLLISIVDNQNIDGLKAIDLSKYNTNFIINYGMMNKKPNDIVKNYLLSNGTYYKYNDNIWEQKDSRIQDIKGEILYILGDGPEFYSVILNRVIASTYINVDELFIRASFYYIINSLLDENAISYNNETKRYSANGGGAN